ncbi:ADP-ribosyl cyclase cyclic ADP-ribose hydrolase-like [Paramuricea clavata]|uniref:ADP-ribosyl cyclase cyclic ADP-ribose hydrolase-like n=1 Tax=Paramuricea clavata TaxID=317549 RepID=A0A7D9HRT7_PARCT|nr:ADP-ribosyl cyclase cyclic ADP-ribose hydrolase-like [Paramuricea clavata]
MQWCGMIKEPGINYKQCPYECANQKAFWGVAAKKMAERSEGVVYAVINGTRQHWKDKQIFSAYMMDRERCGTFSVKALQKQIESRGIKSSCVDDPLSIRALLCLDYPKDALCQFHLTALLK